MTLALGTIEEALFAALARINPNAAAGTPGVAPGPARTVNGSMVRYIGRWVGEPVRTTPVQDPFRTAITKEVASRTPALLLGFDGETIDPRPNAVQVLSGNVETVGLATWTVLAVSSDSRTTNVVMHGTPAGTTSTMGVYDMERLVEEAITNLHIPGLYRVSNVRYLDTRALIVSPGELYVLQVRFQTRRVLADVRETGTDPTWGSGRTDMLEMTARVEPYPPALAGNFPPQPGVELALFPGGRPPEQPPPYYPPLRGLVARFDAECVNGVGEDGEYRAQPETGAPVAQWQDRYSGDWTLSQPDPKYAPSLTTSVIGPAVDMTGAVLSGPVYELPLGAEERTLVAVIGLAGDSGATFQQVAGWGGAAPTTGTEFSIVVARASTHRVAIDAGGTSVLTTSSDAFTGAPWLILGTYNGTSMRVRAVPFAGAGTEASAVVTLATEDALGLVLNTAHRSALYLCELLVYRVALTTDEETELLAYVAQRYGFTGT